MESLTTEIEDRAAQREQIEALFKSRPLEEIEPDELRNITPHYQQRISESRRLSKMRIVNVPRYILVNGRKKKQDGAYMLLMFEPIGRDAAEQIPRGWSETGAYQGEPFSLKP